MLAYTQWRWALWRVPSTSIRDRLHCRSRIWLFSFEGSISYSENRSSDAGR
jgi:hypothetical protein